MVEKPGKEGRFERMRLTGHVWFLELNCEIMAA